MGKYQLIAPYQSDKIYENSNINKCAKKFHNMLKQNNNNCQYFTLKNIEDNTHYKFKNKLFFQSGGGDEEKKDNQVINNAAINEKSNDTEIIEKINKLESRIDNLENKIKELKEEVKMNKEIKEENKEEIRMNKETKEDNKEENKEVKEVKEVKESKEDKKKDNEENESDKVSEGGTKFRGLIPPPKDDDICVVQ
jgi:hypothetical protein